MEFRTRLVSDLPDYHVERMEVFDEDIQMTGASLVSTFTRFGENWIPTLMIGGVGTKPEYRREGHVRQIFERTFADSENKPWVVSLLHPFSYNYYRKFGYEQVCDHRLVTLPMAVLSHIPRCADFRPMKEEDIPELLEFYNNRFACGRQLIPKRAAGSRFQFALGNGELGYLLRENGKICAYLKLSTEKKYIVNHNGEGLLTVHEIAFDSREALVRAIGFLRMFEGELERVFFANLAPVPEVEFLLREYVAEKIEIVPDIAARVLDTVGLLNAAKYPEKSGSFTVRVDDTLPRVAGVFRVDYADGKGNAVRLADDAPWDIRADAAAFVRLVYGYDGADARQAAYMFNVELANSAEDFFRAFPKHPCGVFEHF